MKGRQIFAKKVFLLFFNNLLRWLKKAHREPNSHAWFISVKARRLLSLESPAKQSYFLVSTSAHLLQICRFQTSIESLHQRLQEKKICPHRDSNPWLFELNDQSWQSLFLAELFMFFSGPSHNRNPLITWRVENQQVFRLLKCKRQNRIVSNRAHYGRVVSLEVGTVLLGWVKALDDGWVTPNHRKMAATRLLCNSTTQLLQEGAGKSEQWDQKSWFASGATNLCLDKKVAGSNSERTVSLFTSSSLR